MAKSKTQKEEMLATYADKLAGSAGVIIVNHKGLSVNKVTEFKKQIIDMGGSYNVVKNTLFNLALDKAGLPKLDIVKSGAHAVVFIGEDIPAFAKALQAFIKDNKDNLEIKTGMIDGQILSTEQLNSLADMPTKAQSVAAIAGLLTQPLAGIANVLEDSIRSVAIIINQAFKE